MPTTTNPPANTTRTPAAADSTAPGPSATPNTDASSAAGTAAVSPVATPQAPQAVVARDVDANQLNNLRAYAERGDMQGVINYLDCGVMLMLLNAIRDRDEANAELDAVSKERNEAVAARQRINDAFAPLLK